MASKRQRKRRFIYAQHSEEETQNAIRSGVVEGSVLWDFFSDVALDRVQGNSEFDRGRCEGRRDLAGEILSIAMSKPVVKSEQGDDE